MNFPGRVWTVCLLVAVAMAPAVSMRAQPDLPEYRLKAALLYKFPQFVEWPASSMENRPAVAICVVRPNPFGSALDELLTGETLNGRPLAASYIDRDQPLTNCPVLFVPARANAPQAILRRAAELPILTVGEAPAFLDDGGIINLVMVGGRVRFDVNVPAATRAGLKLSSQLLRLARSVRGGQS